MRKLERPSLSAHTSSVLRKRTKSVSASSDQAAKSKQLWKSRKNKAFQEIRQKLSATCTGRIRCMYCEDSEATDIEHFYPKGTYPLRSFRWDNYLLACSNCNSNFKRTLFPLSSTGEPQLINPFDDEPFEHISLSLSTGKFVPLTPKGRESIKVFGLDRQTLERGRRDTWTVISALITKYDQLDRTTDPDSAQSIVTALDRTSFSCVTSFVRTNFLLGTLSAVAPAEVIAALGANPEIVSAL